MDEWISLAFRVVHGVTGHLLNCMWNLCVFLDDAQGCQCAVSDEVRREAQGAFHVVPGKSGLHVHGKGERVIALEI